MASNFNTSYLESYAKRFAEKVKENAFVNKNYLTGPDILKMSEVKQVNYFVIKALFDEWQLQSGSIRSPYFDYESPEVQKAIQKLMNSLSNNIHIEESDSTNLLVRAISDTLELVYSPYEYFARQIQNTPTNRVSLKYLQTLQKYVKIHQNLLSAYIRQFEADGIEEMFAADAFRLFNSVCEKIEQEPEDTDEIIKEISAIELLDTSQLLHSNQNTSKTETVQTTLHDQLKSEEKPSIAEVHAKQNIESIRKNISINQRIMFVKELFADVPADFDKSIDEFDKLENMNQAEALLQKKTADLKWDQEGEAFVEFVEIIQKRYVN